MPLGPLQERFLGPWSTVAATGAKVGVVIQIAAIRPRPAIGSAPASLFIAPTGRIRLRRREILFYAGRPARTSASLSFQGEPRMDDRWRLTDVCRQCERP